MGNMQTIVKPTINQTLWKGEDTILASGGERSNHQTTVSIFSGFTINLTQKYFLFSEYLPEDQERAANNNDEQSNGEQKGEDCLQNLEENQNTYNKDKYPEKNK